MRVNKLCFCIMSFFFCGISCWAQFSSSIKIGLNLHEMVPYENVVDNRLGFNVGWEGEYNFVELFGFGVGTRFGAAIIQKGSGSRKPEECFNTNSYINEFQYIDLDYISIPLSIELNKDITIKGLKFNVSAGGGIYYSRLISGNASIKVNNSYGEEIINNNVLTTNTIYYGSESMLTLYRFNPQDIGNHLFFDISYKNYAAEFGYECGWNTVTGSKPYISLNGCHNEMYYVAFVYYLKK